MSDIASPPQASVGGAPAGRPVGSAGTRVEVAERTAWSLGSAATVLVLAVVVALVVTAFNQFALADSTGDDSHAGLALALLAVAVLAMTGVGVISPGSTRVVQLFGRYIGTVRRTGLFCTVPLTTRRRL